MTVVKKYLIGLLQVAFLFTIVSCEKDPSTQSPFIGVGDPEEGTGNPYWDWVDAFPGPVSLLVPKLSNVPVKIKGGYDPIAYAPETPILQSTGLYARSSEPIEVYVPVGVENLGWQIGIGQPLYDITIQTGQRRYRDVVTKGKLESGKTNVIKSNFGGFIYFFYEPGTTPMPEDDKEVTVSGAIEALSYTYDQPNASEYVNTMTTRSAYLTNAASTPDELAFVYWTELISDKVILTLGVKEMEFVTNPKALLDIYGKMRDAYMEFAGYDPNDEKQPPMRIVSDIQMPNPHQMQVNNFNQDLRKFGGYPMVSLRSKEMRKRDTNANERDLVNVNGVLQFAPGTSFMHIPDSFGKTVFGDPQTSWACATWIQYPLLRLAALHYSYTQLPEGSTGTTRLPGKYNILFNQWVKNNVFQKDRYMYGGNGDNSYSAYQFALQSSPTDRPWERNAYDHQGEIGGGDDNWINRIEGGITTMYVQLVEQYGWDIISYLFTRARELNFKNELQQDSFDYIMMACCEFTGRNMTPFFKWWHFPYTERAAKFAKKFPALEGDTYYIDDAGNGQTEGTTPYFFVTRDFPDNPVLVRSKGFEPTRKSEAEWGEKPYYKKIEKKLTTDRDSTKNQGWRVHVGIQDPVGIAGTPAYPPNPSDRNWYMEVDANQRLVDGKYDDRTNWFRFRYISNDLVKAARVAIVTVYFLDNNKPVTQEFNTLEICGAKSFWKAPYFNFLYNFSIYVPDNFENPVPGEGRWIDLSENDPDITGNWYEGVIWTLKLRPWVHGLDPNMGMIQQVAYYFEETYKATAIRFKANLSWSDRNGEDAGINDQWDMGMMEMDLGLMSPENPEPPAPGDPDYVPLWKYTYPNQYWGNQKGTLADYEARYGSDPAPQPFKGWLNTAIRKYDF